MIETLVVLAVVAVVALTATQRKKLLTAYRSVANNAINKCLNDVKVAELKVDELKVKGEKIVDAIAQNRANISRTEKVIVETQTEIDELTLKAKQHKENGEKDKAVSIIRQRTAKQEALNHLEENLKSLMLIDEKTNVTFEKIKADISLLKTRVQIIKTKSTNIEALQSIQPTISGNTDTEDAIGDIEDNIDLEEAKLNARFELLSKSDDISGSLNDEYDNL